MPATEAGVASESAVSSNRESGGAPDRESGVASERESSALS